MVIFIVSILIILVLIIYYFIKHRDLFSIDHNILYPSDKSGDVYHVHSLHNNKSGAADMFSIINYNTELFINKLYDKYKNSDYATYKRIATFLKTRYNPGNLRESSPLNIDKDTSFTINKGDIIAICIRNKSGTYEIHDFDTIFFVVLHEISHLSLDAYDHPSEFWINFKWILVEAERLDIYYSPDFNKFPMAYCGININYNPRYDPSIPLL